MKREEIIKEFNKNAKRIMVKTEEGKPDEIYRSIENENGNYLFVFTISKDTSFKRINPFKRTSGILTWR